MTQTETQIVRHFSHMEFWPHSS